MFILSIVLLPMGLVMLIQPQWIWAISEEWKSNDATEPSDLYLLSTRLGGVVSTLVGLGGIIASFFL
ncbi:hypothetical protein D3P09_13600 [Paenibacillus pinisoli]|uniref:DUF6199 domain-containing protein n=1 Tax=Paenibacillus pinisoli TaxID=1276110 RepID=A0A3A6PG63_9BACL|nr:hypothetical protein D3P09_13600 [Paenibacillus pinisoli]